MTESDRIDIGLYRFVDEEAGVVVYQGVYDGQTTSVAVVPIEETMLSEDGGDDEQ